MEFDESFQLPDADDLPHLDGSQGWSRSPHRPEDDCNVTAAPDEGGPDEEEGAAAEPSVACSQQTAFLAGLGPSQELQGLLGRCQAYAHFYEVLSPLQALERSMASQSNAVAGRAVVLHTVAVAEPGELLVVSEGRWRTLSLREGSQAHVNQVLVHHDPGPSLRRYVAVHMADGALTLLRYTPLQVAAHFSGVRSVSSEDADGAGRPQLIIVKCSGERVRWSPLFGDLGEAPSSSASTEPQHPPPTAAQRQVTLALNNHLKRAVSQVSLLEHSCLRRQVFVARHVMALRSALSGRPAQEALLGDTRTASEPMGPAPPPNVRQASAKRKAGTGLLSVSSVRWRWLHHDSLVLCVAVHSAADRHLISDLELVLHSQPPARAGPGPPSLHYTSSVYKSVQRRRRGGGGLVATGEGEGRASATSIEPMKPCVLRPGKQAFVVAVCRLPSFVGGPTATLSGLVQFRSRPLSDLHSCSPTSSKTKLGEAHHPHQGSATSPPISPVLQARIPSVTLDVRTLDRARVCLDAPPPRAGVSLDCVALVTGSKQQRVLVSSRLCPVTQQQLLADLAAACPLTQVRDVSGLWVLCAGRPSSPLHLAALCMDSAQSGRALPATLYFRDQAQGVALVHAIRSVLPFDALVLPAKPAHESADGNTFSDQIRLLDADGSNTERQTRQPQTVEQDSPCPPQPAETLERVLVEMRRIVQFLVDSTKSELSSYVGTENLGESVSSLDNKHRKVERPSSITKGVGDVHDRRDPAESSTKHYEEDRARFEAANRGVRVPRHVYDAWKRDLHKLQWKLDSAYVSASFQST